MKTKKMAKCIYWRQKKAENVHSLPNKKPGPVRTYSHPQEGGGGYSGFQVTGMIEGVFWVWNFRFRDFFGYENLASIFWGSLIWVRIFWGGIKRNRQCRNMFSYEHCSHLAVQWSNRERNILILNTISSILRNLFSV